MSVIKTIIQSVLSSVLSSVLKIVSPVELAITEFFIKLSSTAGSFYSLGTPTVYDGDFEVEFKFQLSELTQDYIIVGSAASDNYLRIDAANNGFDFKIGGSFKSNDGTYSFDNKLHKGIFRRIGSVGQVEVDGVLVVNAQGVNTSPFQVAYIAARQNLLSNFFNGIISDVKLTDLDTPANSLVFKLNKLTDNFEYPAGNVFGSQEVSNNTFDNTTGWSSPRFSSTISVVNNKLRSTADSTNTFGSAIALTGLVIGEVYAFKGSATCNNPIANIRLRVATDSSLGSTIVDTASTSSVSVDTHFIATATTLYAGTITTGQNSGDHVDIDAGISIQSVTNVITYQNIPESARQEYTLNDGFYSGIQRVINGDFATGDLTGFVETRAGQLTTVNDGSVVIDLNGLPDGGIRQSDIILPIGTMFTFGFDLTMLEDFGNDNFFSLSAAGFDQNEVLESGRQFFTFISDQENGNITIRAARGNNRTGSYSLENIFLEERINIAPQITPVTQEMTLTQAWTVSGDGYDGLQNSTAASARVDAVISNTDDGILMEAGASYIGLILYVYDGVLYFQCGDGSAFGSASDRAEVSYTLPVGEFNYIIECSANTSNAVLYVNGLAVGSQAFSKNGIAGSDEGTVGQVRLQVAVNRGGWTAGDSGVYTNNITKCDIFNGQVTPDV
jgi:hypothetical protein